MNPEIENLKRRLEVLEKSSSINRNLDNQSKDILGQIISSNILDIVWNDYFYHSTFWESADGLAVGGTGGTVTSTGTGLTIQTGAVLNNEPIIFKSVLKSEDLRLDKEQRFRTTVRVDSTTNVDSFITIGEYYATPSNFYGFRINGSSVTGYSSKGGTTSETISLFTYTANQYLMLEARFFPGVRIVFYINGVEKGVITTNIPTLGGLGIANMQDFYTYRIKTTDANNKTLYAQAFSYIQKK